MVNESGTRHTQKAYLVADLDFNGPLPVVRQFCIFSNNPYHEPGLGRNRTWAVLMVREADSFARAKQEILGDLETGSGHRPYLKTVIRMLDEAPDTETHALKYRLPQALDTYIAAMPVPAHPFFGVPEPPREPSIIPLIAAFEGKHLHDMTAAELERSGYPHKRVVIR